MTVLGDVIVWLTYGLSGALVALLVTVLMIASGIGDTPGTRSSHKNVTPTAGGLSVILVLAIMTGLSLAYSALGLGSLAFIAPDMAPLLALTFAVSLLGLCDDLYQSGPGWKFLIMVLIASLAVWQIEPVRSLTLGVIELDLSYPVGFVGSVLWIIVVVNAINFMDGINGIIIASLGVASAILFALTSALNLNHIAVLALVIFCVLLALIPFNFRRRAMVFMGDVGALSLGFLFAVSILLFARDGLTLRPTYLGVYLLLPLLVDVFLTLARRALAGQALWTAHRDHLYQKWVDRGTPALRVSLLYGLMTAICGAIGVLAVYSGLIRSLALLLALTGLLSILHMGLYARFNSPARQHNPPNLP